MSAKRLTLSGIFHGTCCHFEFQVSCQFLFQEVTSILTVLSFSWLV